MIMKKALLTAAAAILSLSFSSVVTAGNIEKAERYSAPSEQNVVDMDASAVETGQEIASSELGLSLGRNAEVQELGGFGFCTWGRGGFRFIEAGKHVRGTVIIGKRQ